MQSVSVKSASRGPAPRGRVAPARAAPLRNNIVPMPQLHNTEADVTSLRDLLSEARKDLEKGRKALEKQSVTHVRMYDELEKLSVSRARAKAALVQLQARLHIQREERADE